MPDHHQWGDDTLDDTTGTTERPAIRVDVGKGPATTLGAESPPELKPTIAYREVTKS